MSAIADQQTLVIPNGVRNLLSFLTCRMLARHLGDGDISQSRGQQIPPPSQAQESEWQEHQRHSIYTIRENGLDVQGLNAEC